MVKIPLIPHPHFKFSPLQIHQIHQILVMQRCRPCRLMLAEHIGIDSLKRWGPRVDAPPVDGLWMICCASKWNQNRDKIATGTTFSGTVATSAGSGMIPKLWRHPRVVISTLFESWQFWWQSNAGMPLDSSAPVTQETVCPWWWPRQPMCGKCSILRQLPVFSQRLGHGPMANFHRFGGKNVIRFSVLGLPNISKSRVTSVSLLLHLPDPWTATFRGHVSWGSWDLSALVMLNSKWWSTSGLILYIYIYNIVCSPHPSYGMGYDGVEPGQAYRHLRSKRHGCPEHKPWKLITLGEWNSVKDIWKENASLGLRGSCAALHR